MLAGNLKGKIIFEKEFSDIDAFRGIEEYTHLYVIWEFSENKRDDWSPTVRPPRLGGNKRVGVFATRSPFRPNSLGLSIVELNGVHKDNGVIVLDVSGADLMDGTPIYDIKPYLPYVDCHPEAKGGFAEEKKDYSLKVEIRDEFIHVFTEEKLAALKELLSQDPRPSYQDDPKREYGFEYAGKEVKFRVVNGVLTVTNVI
jgi:tRNA-Thr(GGU) m(6)t(6)A37 methyltransferase TsaA